MAEALIPLRKNVIDTFAKEPTIHYARHDNGAVYVSNSYYLLKTNQAGLEYLTAQVNRRKRASDITVTENKGILDYVEDANGAYELTQKPYVAESGKDIAACFYADGTQYFAYNKRYVDILKNFDNRLFVGNYESYDVYNHRLVSKSPTGEVLGVALPLRITEETYEKLADVLPLTNRKSELERIKENPTNDPYIGREFFDGRDTYIISSIRRIAGVDMYVAPRVEGGKVSRSGDYIEANEMEEQILRWETARIDRDNQNAAREEQAQKDAVIKAEYENSKGFADKLSPMHKENVLKALNDRFVTKDYGNLSVKDFISKVLADGKTLAINKTLKKKYAEMDMNKYLQGIRSNTQSEVWAKCKAISSNAEGADSPNALWLKEHHPFLHYRLFKDSAVLDDSYFNAEYRVMVDDSGFYTITKTAYNYGKYLTENAVGENSHPDYSKSERPVPDTGHTDR
jgi:hypothetical protein